VPENTTNIFFKNYGWYTLEPGTVVKFSITSDDCPLFVNACPAILDLDAA